jgi:flagellar biosynthesis anti-sigma factor FlgM
MRVDPNHGTQPAPESNRPGAQSSAAGNSSAAGGLGLGEDQASLSGGHAQIEALAAQAAQLPEVRQERVHALRQAIQGGQYDPAPETVAGAVVAHMLIRSAA